MTAHMYGTGPFDHYGKSVPIRSGQKPADLLKARDLLVDALNFRRENVNRDLPSTYSEGYDRGLTHAITLIDGLIDGEDL